MSLKSGVRLAFHSSMGIAYTIAMDVFRQVAGQPAIITSGDDGQHKKGSLHYEGKAFDLRMHHVLVHQRSAVFAQLKQRLPGFDVIYEGQGTPNEHIHVEYDPDHTNG